MVGFTSRDMFAEIDGDLFRRALRRSGFSYQELADGATSELRKIARSERRKHRTGVPEGVSKSLVEQLVNERTRMTHELRAVAIERALGVSDGDLFVPRVVRGARSTQQRPA